MRWPSPVATIATCRAWWRTCSRCAKPRSGCSANRRQWIAYVFLTTAVGDGYGGLEHRASTALLCSRNDLPYAGMDEPTEGYRQFLGLCSHEYFHTWNVKRIKPAAFVPYDLSQEGYTRLLWAFEGFTSYYDGPDAGAQRADRREGLPGAVVEDHHAGAQGQRSPQAERGRVVLRGVDQVLPPGRKQPQRHRQLLHQGFAGGLAVRPAPAHRQQGCPQSG